MSTHTELLPSRSPKGLADPLFGEARARQRRRRSRILVALAALASIGVLIYGVNQLAATTNPVRASAPTNASPVVDACGLLNPTELQTILGRKAAYRTDQTLSCTWTSVPLGRFTSASEQLTVQAAPFPLAQFTKKIRELNGNLTPISGLGYRAFVNRHRGELGVWTWHRGYLLNISSYGGPASLKTDLAAAQLVLKHL